MAGIKYNLEILSVVDDNGKKTADAGDELKGLFYEQANLKVIEMLETKNALLAKNKFLHSYPYDWRYKKPVIFRATEQWFISIKPIKEQLLKAIDDVKWIPKWGHERIKNMFIDRADWCISRQRIWGVPIPIIYNEDGSPICEKTVFDHIAEIFKKEGSVAWWNLEAKDLLPPNYKNKKSPNGKFYKETDTMDVWFDSGSTHTSVLKARGLIPHADVYFEGNDQYRGWFNSSLITSMYLYNKAPYNTVVTHGMIVDTNGNKMSKSLGNVIDPSDIVTK
jgi:isoleucyl-tRNA synthetase